jgi:hypothetical protein
MKLKILTVHHSPHPQKFVSLINRNISQLEASPEDDETQLLEADQNKPQTPPPENDHPEHDHQKYHNLLFKLTQTLMLLRNQTLQ